MDSQSSEQAVIAEFVAAALATGQVWSLRDADGWALAVSEEDDERLVMPFWTDADAAARCAQDEWAGFEVAAVPLDAFIGNWLPGMAEDGYAIGLDWEADASGAAAEPELLLEAFDGLGGDVAEDDDT